MEKYDNILLSSRKYKLQRDFWIKYLQDLDVEPILQPQTGSHNQEHPGKGVLNEPHRIDLFLEPEISEQLIKLSKNSDKTLYIVMLSAFMSFLYRYTGKNDIFLGSPVFPLSGKKNLFNDLLVFRKVIDGNKTFKDILLGVREIFMEIIENQDYPFKKIIEELEFLTDRTYDRLFDLIFTSANIHKIPGIKDNGGNFQVSFYRNEHHIKVSFEITSGDYTRGEIERTAKYFNRFLALMVTDSSVKLSETELLDQEEKKRVLFDFNDTAARYPRQRTIHELFTEQAEKSPQCTAIMHEDHYITYRMVNAKSDQLAGRLGNMGVKRDQIVGILTRYSPELIIGILGILKAGAAYLPLSISSTARSRFMLKDCAAKLVVITKGSPDAFLREIGGIDAVYPDQSCPNTENTANNPCDPTNLAYVIYTSGTTGKPKGVMIQHQGLVNYIYWAAKKYVKNERLYFPLHTSIAFDLTVTSIFTPLITGQAIVIYGGEVDEPPIKIEKIIRENKVGIVKLTPSHLKLFSGKQMSGGISTIKRLIVGGEALTTQLALETAKYFRGDIEIYNEYGPTEATVGCMIYQFNEINDRNRTSVPIGIPADNIQIYILDRQMRPVPPGITGEIYISGDGVARGYLNRPELTSEKILSFFYRSSRSHKSYIPKNLYKTGDLALMLPEGNLEFAGRIDQQVKIRGHRIEPGEIERCLLAHNDVKEVVVLAGADRFQEKYLCAYIVPRSSKATASLSASQLRKFSSLELPAYMIPSYFMILDKIPLTPNGKVDRKALPDPGTGGAVDGAVAPRDQLEKTLEELWQQVLFSEETKKEGKKSIGIDANFFELGGHSLNATILVSKIHKVLNVKVSLTQMFKAPTIRGLSEYIKDTSEDQYIGIEVVPPGDYYELSSAQKRLYIVHQMEAVGTGYNIPSIVKLTGICDKVHLENTFKKLINRHDSLRTSFVMQEEEPVQRIHEEVAFNLEYDETTGDDPEQAKERSERITANFFKPFDLSRAPLLRVGLIKVDDGGPVHLLMVDMHHIISDGVSMEIFTREFMALSGGEELSPLRLQYKDYARWHNREQRSDAILKQEQYWTEVFSGEIPVLNLPVDYTRPVVQSFAGDRLNFEVGEAQTRALRELALKEGVTLYMVLVALFNTFLYKITGQLDIVIGTPIAGRRHADLIDIIGMFVNTLALRNHVASQQSFNRYLGEVKENTLAAFENQEYQYENLVDNVSVVRDTGRNPLFDVMLVLQNVDSPKIEIPGLILEPHVYNNYTSKFDLTLEVIESDEALLFTLEYCTQLFKKQTSQRLIDFFKKITSIVTAFPGIKISEIEIISAEEKKQLLFEFNNTTADYPKTRLIHELFEEEAAKRPQETAVVYEGQSLSYAALHQQARQMAAYLQCNGLEPEVPVGIMLDASLDMITAVLAVLNAGGAYVPIDPQYPGERIKYMLKDSGVNLLVTASSLFEDRKIGRWDGKAIFLSSPGNSPLERGGPKGRGVSKVSVGSRQPAASAAHLAYIIYTSGSTGRPKGVMVDHHNVIRLVRNTNYIAFKADDRILQTGALEFDASTFEIWGALLNGLVLYLAPKEKLLNPSSLKELIVGNKISILWLTAPLFNQIVQADTDIFATLSHLLVGGDILSPSHINQIRRRFPQLYIINGYGPTENTTFSTTFLIEKEYKESIPIGKPIANSFAYIVDEYDELQPIGLAGELYVGGDGVSRGYLNNPELTAESFLSFFNRSYRSYKSYISKKLYKTGDLARWLPCGNIEFLGRIDQQVKIRGFRIELGEIENHLLAYDHIKEAVVLARNDKKGDKHLCAYIAAAAAAAALSPEAQITDRMSLPHDPAVQLDTGELKSHLSHSLPNYMVPSYFVILEKIPLTPNGKVDRRALPEPEAAAVDQYQAPQNNIEKTLTEIWSRILGIDKDTIGINADFFELGGHSLKATLLVSKIHKALNVNISLTDIFTKPCIRELAAYIKEAREDKYISMVPAETKDYYMLSSAQRRLYVLQQLDERGIGYNIPMIFVLKGEVEQDRIEHTFTCLIKRHESLRTSFVIAANQPKQRIHKEVEFEIEYDQSLVNGHWSLENCQGRGEVSSPIKVEKIIRDFIRPFDLSYAPLLRVGLIRVKQCQHLLMVDMHHIISDGTSMDVFVKDFMTLYGGGELPALGLQYKDFSEWQNCKKHYEAVTQQEEYWLKLFAGEIPVLNLPCDYVRPVVQSFEGSISRFEMDTKETRALKAFALKEGVTLFMVLLSMYVIFLSKLANQEDIVVGTPTAGRRHTDLQHIIGMFINTLALRNYPTGGKPFNRFLSEVKERALAAFAHQDYPYEELVEAVAVDRDTGRNPLFDTMFILQNMDIAEIVIPGVTLKPYDDENIIGISKFDLTLIALEKDEKLLFTLEYGTRLFKKETIETFIRYFKETIYRVLKDPDEKISGIEIIPGKEKQRLLFDFNNTAVEYPKHKTIHQLFTEQVEMTPDHIAAAGLLPIKNRTDMTYTTYITYRELNEQSDRLAYLLKRKGAKPDTIVGLLVERSVEMMIAIFGILQAGGAYLPIDPEYPGERVAYMLRDANVRRIVKNSNTFAGLTVDDYPGVAFHDTPSQWSSFSHLHREAVCAANLAYVIYTSGSTGKPKGVMIGHRSLVNFIQGMTDILDFKASDCILSLTTISFDIFGLETLLPLIKGCKVVIGGREEQLNPEAAVRVISQQQVTILQVTPSRLSIFISNEKAAEALRVLKYLLVGGEALPEQLLQRARELCGGRIYNLYGPTETTIWSTVKEVSQGKMLNIGKPIANTRIYILGEGGTLQPISVSGELCIGGHGLARGYLNRPELTAEKFFSFFYRSYRSYKSYISKKIYKTGDLARWLPNGNIEFLGRKDDQVKIRGYRVELKEIERMLLTHPAIAECTAAIKDITVKDKHICAYYVSVSGETLTVSDLRQYLAGHLPGYMIPSYFINMKELPLTANGKVDRKALPQPEGFRPQLKQTFVAPGTDLEKLIADAWAEVLPMDMAGIHDNFFDLGGNSMELIMLGRQLKEKINREIPVVTMFTYPTIHSLAVFLSEDGGQGNLSQKKDQQAQKLNKAKDRLKQTVTRMKDNKMPKNVNSG